MPSCAFLPFIKQNYTAWIENVFNIPQGMKFGLIFVNCNEKELCMNRAMRFSSAAMGMVLLAGLAYYQGNVDHTSGGEDALAGTALAEMRDGNCESTAGLDGPAADECAEKEQSSGNE